MLNQLSVMDGLASNIFDVIKEEQIKLGYRKEKIGLYYPLSSLNILLGTQIDCAKMHDNLKEYFAERKDIFGEVEVTYKEERFCIALPEQVSEYVYMHTEKEGFLYDFIDVISKHGATIEEVLHIFEKYSDDVYFKKVSDDDFDYLIYFVDGNPDSYRYCLTEEGHHLIYHRYTKEDYEVLFG